MDEVDKVFTDKQLSLSARGLFALVIAIPPEQKISWSDLQNIVSDKNELKTALCELRNSGRDIWKIRSTLNSSCARVRMATTILSFFMSTDEITIQDKDKSSCINAHAQDADYPEEIEDVIRVAAERSYMMSISEAANFLGTYAITGWVLKDGRKVTNWRFLLDRWKIGQSREQYLNAQGEWRRRKAGLPPQEQEKYVTLETGEKWPESQSIYLHDYNVWVKASGVC